jgi:hypothetical protein
MTLFGLTIAIGFAFYKLGILQACWKLGWKIGEKLEAICYRFGI